MFHHEDVAGRALGEKTIAKEHRLHRAGVHRDLAQQHVAEQRDRLDVAAAPAEVRCRHRGDAAARSPRGRRGQRAAHHEDGRRCVLGEGVVALRDPARHLQVDALVLPGVALERDHAISSDHSASGMRIRDAYRVEARLQPREVLGEPERRARVHRDHFVDAVAEDETAVQHRHARLRKGQPAPRSGRRSGRSLAEPQADRVDAATEDSGHRHVLRARPAETRRSACLPV